MVFVRQTILWVRCLLATKILTFFWAGQAYACNIGARHLGWQVGTSLTLQFLSPKKILHKSPKAIIGLHSAFPGSSLRDPPQPFLSSTPGTRTGLL